MSSLYKHTKILVVLILILVGNIAVAQTVVFPNDSVNKVSYSIQIDFKGAYLSGVCILVKDENIIKSSIMVYSEFCKFTGKIFPRPFFRAAERFYP